MARWDPAALRRRAGLSINDAERQQVLARFAPLKPEALWADGVFEGGGVLGTAFLGALRVCQEIGLNWGDLAGTSAGAITATLLAAGYTVDELDEVLGDLDYSQFVQQRTSRLLFPLRSPSDDLDDDLLKLITLLWTTGQKGEYTTTAFADWIARRLDAKGLRRFADLPTLSFAGIASMTPAQRRLKVIASDVTRGLMLVLPDSLAFAPYNAAGPPAQFPVADAVRFSMSIPLFFEPGELAGSTIVDGGITSNFPLWTFDVATGQPPPYPTFGFRLVDNQPVPQVRNAIDILKGMINTMRFAHDRHFLQEKELGRVVNIDLTGVKAKATSFQLEEAEKDELYIRGYRAAKDFFVNRWSWSKHLRERGFVVEAGGTVRPLRPGEAG